jgi:hypothetical protein
MVSFIAFIITFFLFIPTFRRMDRSLHRKGDSLPTRVWKRLFHDGVDGELARMRTELDHLSETMRQQRAQLTDPSTNTKAKEQLTYSLDMTTRNYVRLLRQYEVDMTDDEFEKAMIMLHGHPDSGQVARILWTKTSI